MTDIHIHNNLMNDHVGGKMETSNTIDINDSAYVEVVNSSLNTYTFKAGEIIYFSAQKGPVYRVLNGGVRLDRQFNDIEPTFANLAVAHDLIGVEVLVEGSYSFEARALTDCQIEVWSEPVFLWVESFAKELLQSFKRKADVVTLRCGTAKQRVLNLIHLLEQDGEDLRLPRLRDISEITDLTSCSGVTIPL